MPSGTSSSAATIHQVSATLTTLQLASCHWLTQSPAVCFAHPHHAQRSTACEHLASQRHPASADWLLQDGAVANISGPYLPLRG